MSGNNSNLLDTGLMIAAGVAAPELAPVFMEELGVGSALGTGLAGAALGGAAGTITGKDPLQSALMGGLGGYAAGAYSGCLLYTSDAADE